MCVVRVGVMPTPMVYGTAFYIHDFLSATFLAKILRSISMLVAQYIILLLQRHEANAINSYNVRRMNIQGWVLEGVASSRSSEWLHALK